MDFKGFAFRQLKNSPLQITFVATSSEVDSWAKVPTKLSNRPVGFQRAAIPRHVREVKNFFHDDTKTNCSPTAILLGIEPEHVDRVTLLKRDGSLLDAAAIGSESVDCIVRVEFAPWSAAPYDTIDDEIAALFEEVRPMYESLATIPPPSASADESESEQADEGELDVGVPPSDDDDHDEEEDDLAEESQNGADGDQEDTSDIPALLARISPTKLVEIVEQRVYSSWEKSSKEALRDQLKDDRKIGVIIDGQHRVKGTARQGPIPFIVSLLPDANWAELAFQFLVNNSTAQNVDAGLLIAIVGHSLTPEEVAATQGRLYRSGVQVKLIQAVMSVDSEENPFNGMLKFGIPGEKGFLEAPAMQKKVVRLWYGTRGRSGTRPRFSQLRLNVEGRQPINMEEIFGGVCKGANASERARDWQDRRWFPYFRAFWKPIAEHFKGDLWPASRDGWPVGSKGAESSKVQDVRKRLMRVTVLGLLQSAVLYEWWSYEREKWEEKSHKPGASYKVKPADLEKGIARFIKRIPAQFFTELRFSGFDASKDTRADLQKQLMALLNKHDSFANMRTVHKFWQGNK